MKNVKNFFSFINESVLIEDLEDICLELKDLGYTVEVRERIVDTSLKPEMSSSTKEIGLSNILIHITDFNRGYLSHIHIDHIVPIIQRVYEYLSEWNIQIITHRKNHSSQEEELKLHGGRLMDLENNPLDYRIYWISLFAKKL